MTTSPTPDTTQSPTSLKGLCSNARHSSPEHTTDRKSPQPVGSVHRGSPVLSSRVNWDLHHDYSDDDSMSEDDLDHRHTATNSGVSDDDVLLSDWETLPRNQKLASRSTTHSVSYIGHLPIPRDEEMSTPSESSRQPAFPGNREIMGRAHSQLDERSVRIEHSRQSSAGSLYSSSHRHRSPVAQRVDYEGDRDHNLSYHYQRRPSQSQRERACSPSCDYAHHNPTPYRTAYEYEERSSRCLPSMRSSVPDLVSRFTSFRPSVSRPLSNSPSPATSLSTLPPTPPVQYSRMPHGYTRAEMYPADQPRWHYREHSPYRGVRVHRDDFYVPVPPSPQTSSSPTSSLQSLASTPSGEPRPLPSTEISKPPRDKNAWKKYTKTEYGPNNELLFHCLYTPPGVDQKPCGYTAKRHLVKRHVETRHLQIKDHICDQCGRAFPQRVSLRIHMNRHTGMKPHECNFGCGKAFSDPARKHKHMVEVHNYIPKGPRKRSKAAIEAQNSRFETMAPWVAKSDLGGGQ